MSISRFASRLSRKLAYLKSKIPWINTLKFNFIFIHYAYIIGVTIIGSVYLYPGGNLAYTDALFLAAGSATQSGLNTIDLDRLSTYQQVGLWLGSMIANPIVIHSSVVFIRLRWFEKRFQHVVQEAKMMRRTRTRTRSRAPSAGSASSASSDMNRLEMGVRGRKITVLRDNEGQALGHFIEPKSKSQEANSIADSSGASNGGDAQMGPENDSDRSKTTEVPAGISTDSHIRSPMEHGPDHYITFIENQRRPTQALRIPSPREFDRGGVPETIDDFGDEPSRSRTVQSDQEPEISPLKQQQSRGQHITIDEPNIARSRRATTFPRTSSRVLADGETADVGEPALHHRRKQRRGTLASILFFGTKDEAREAPYLSWQPTLGRNSAFVDLTEEQKNELGGIEYRALKALAYVLIAYFVFFHVLGIISLVPWILHTRWGIFPIRAAVGRPWWAVFIAGSAFNNQGFSLTPNSLASFYDAIFPLLLMTFLIIIGNTGFPCMLRFIIWCFWKIFPKRTAVWEEFHFLLDHPRRCFTLLFPSSATWWLFWVLVVLNVIDLVLFIILDLNDTAVTSIPGGLRFVDGLFQAAATRTAGLSIISLSELHPGVQVSYMIMMYISIYPIAISLRKTNVYEEKSLGIYYGDEEDELISDKDPSYVAAHLRRQLGFDIWYIFLGLFIISIVEGSRVANDPQFTMFGILFEVVSAYGTVGLSQGYPGTNTSLSAQFKVISKLVIIAMMIRGRHRGLPYQLDRAILLPSEALHEKELRDATMRVRRRGSTISAMAGAARCASRASRDGYGTSTGWQQGPSGSPWTLGARSPQANTNARLPIHHEERSS
ncbi:potassium ion transporter [Coccidioides posadasii str. Silveira]|uniref:Potassium transport protein n=3 Tax=Coccidioides posadasii TaxID=199306 RepID=E9CSR7_COCPS|nr:potassium ion transporter [Coccidioides posadasii str. Silveira]